MYKKSVSYELMNDLEIIASRFRVAIESAINAGEQETFFRMFPTGQCGYTTDILIQYLLDQGYHHIFYVNGSYYGESLGDCWSHTWLEVDGIIVDITGDQFKNHLLPLKYDVPVYVGPIDKWHKNFDFEDGSYYEHRGLEKSWTNYRELVRWYEIIKKYL